MNAPTLPRSDAPLPLSQARSYADHILTWLSPFCTRIEIAGSIRRGLPTVNDIDIVCIPKTEDHKDLLGAVTSRTNHLFDHLLDYIRDQNPLNSPGRAPRIISGADLYSPQPGKQLILQLKKCQLDLWFADETTLATRLLCRTGSKEHNIWLCQRATDRGLHWNPYEGLSLEPTGLSPAKPVSTPTEAAIYTALGLEFIDPKNRELHWIRKNIDSGL